MNYSIDITVATKRDLADAFDYIDGMLMNPFPLLPTPCWQVGKFASFLFRII